MHTERVVGNKSLQALAAELLAELPADAKGHTADEFGAAWGCDTREAVRRIRVLVASRKLVKTGTRRVTRDSGRSDHLNVYDKPTPAGHRVTQGPKGAGRQCPVGRPA